MERFYDHGCWGPNSRKDYHVDPVEEFFYQIEGDMLLKIIDDQKRVISL
ncbi:MAG: hypothetical protein CM1200mP10_33170 [Candidatus Neomarinimicrobiota bacterium]|nr:MAG: hypothetical protein CM1200mP10_33170 [Candidatus Neomarinimicrobiota bacterium]